MKSFALSPRSQFSSAAPAYDSGALIQKDAASRLLSLVEGNLQPRTILDVGCGSGQLTALARERWPAARITAIDAAPGMIDEARRRLPGSGVEWLVRDVMDFPAQDRHDLVLSNCALHWLHPLPDGLAHVANLVGHGGTLAVSMMLRGTLSELHAARRHAAPAMLPLAAMPSAEYVATLLSQAGLTVDAARESQSVQSAPSGADVLRHLNALGLTGGALSRGARGLTRAELHRLREFYDREFRRPDGSVPVSYHVGYFIAEKL